ncbi:MAG: hypothetical protein M3419_06480 [Actinomycetota bacterium]|nr:hypothetical protein [Actinomycetota bacterium]
MRKFRLNRAIQASVLASALGGSLFAAMPAASAATQECTGTLSGVTVKRLVVPEGETCTLEDVTVKQGVTVRPGGALITDDSEIGGNVIARGARTVQIIDTNVGRNIKVTGTTGATVIGSDGCKVDPLAGNNIQVRDSLGNVAICFMTVKNNIQLSGNAGLIGVFDNVVGNSLQARDNSGKFSRFRRNVVDNNIQISRNDSTVRLVDNTATGQLMCKGNVPAPSGEGNTASKLTGQCKDLG